MPINPVMNTPNLGRIQKFITTYFSNDEIAEAAFSEFHEFYINMPDGVSRSTQALHWVDYCYRHGRLDYLLRYLHNKREIVFVNQLGDLTSVLNQYNLLNKQDINNQAHKESVPQKIIKKQKLPSFKIRERGSWFIQTPKQLLLCAQRRNNPSSITIFSHDHTQEQFAFEPLWSINNVAIIREPVYWPDCEKLLLSLSFEWNMGASGLRTIDLHTGKEMAAFHQEKDVSRPLPIGDTVFLTTFTKKAVLLRFDEVYKEVWSQEIPVWQPGQTAVLDNQQIYVSMGKLGVYRYWRGDGRITNKYELQPNEGKAILDPLVLETSLIVVTSNGFVISFDKTQAERIWTIHLGRAITTGPLIINEQLIVGNKGKEPDHYEINAVHLQTGTPIWNEPFSLGKTSHFQAPLASFRNTIYCISDNGTMYALNAQDGRCLGMYQFTKYSRCQPLITEIGHILIADRNCQIVEYNQLS